MKLNAENNTQYNRFENDEDSFNFKEIIRKNIRYWPFFVCSVFVAFLTAFLVNQFTPPVYKIESKFLIKEESNAMNLFDFSAAGGAEILPKGQKMANETINLKSKSVAERVLDQLPFYVEYYEEGYFINSEIYKKTPISVEVDWSHPQLTNGQIKITWQDDQSYQLEFVDKKYNSVIPDVEKNLMVDKPEVVDRDYPFDQWVTFSFGKFRVIYNGPEKTGSLIFKLKDKESLIVQYTGDKLQIFPSDKISSILTFSLETSQPEKGRDYLNMLMKVFLEKELDEKNSLARNTLNFIDSQLLGISDSMNHAENKLEKFRSSHRTYDITSEGNTIFEKLSELEKSLAEENFKKTYYQNLQDYLVNEDYSEIVVPSGIGIDDPVLNKLIGDLITLQADKSRFLATQTEDSPTVQEVNRKIAEQKKSIKEVLKNVNQNTSLLVNDIEKRIAKIGREFGGLPQTEQDLLNIKRKYSLNETIYTFLLQRRAESAIALASNKASNRIVEPAVLTALSFIPMPLRPLLNYFLAMLLGLIIPIAVIFSIDLFTVKIIDIKEVEHKLKVPFIGCIGQNNLYPPLVVLNNPRSSITEAFRALRTNINFIFPKDKPVTIMITSSIAGEGKTFCAMNLASVYSIGGKKTILVGCDMHKSFKFGDLKISNTLGLSNFLSGQVDAFRPLIQKTEYDKLDVLVPGPTPPNPAELLINDRFEQMITELKQIYDVVILDSSPIGITNETLYLTNIADLTIFILRQNYSHKSFVDDVNSLKLKKGVKSINVIVNDVAEKHLNHKGYGYGYYSEDQNKSISIKRMIGNMKTRITSLRPSVNEPKKTKSDFF